MTSSVDQPSWESLFKAARDNTMVMLHTMLPGIVVSYDESTRTAVIQPAIYDGAEAMEPIEDVPVLFPRGGGFRLVFPLVKGDEVEIRFSKIDPARFLVTGEVSKADNVRRGGLYGFAVPASISDTLLSGITSTADSICLGMDDGTVDIVVGTSQIKLGSSGATSGVAKGDISDSNFQALYDFLVAHVHPTAVGPTSPPGPSPTVPTMETTESTVTLTD